MVDEAVLRKIRKEHSNIIFFNQRKSLQLGPSITLVEIYQTLESLMGIIFDLFGGVIADRFQRKRIIILTDFLSGLAYIILSFINVEAWLIYAIIIANVFLAFYLHLQIQPTKPLLRKSWKKIRSLKSIPIYKLQALL